MTHMILGDIENAEMEVLDEGSVVTMEPSDSVETVDMDVSGSVVVRYEHDYDKLINRPSINEHLLVGGENSLNDLGISKAKNIDINRLFA